MTEKSLTEEYIKELSGRFESVRRNIENASGGRAVTLLAATKTVPADVINYAINNLGLTYVGENRVQELLAKYDALRKDGLHIHFIGRLQKNKVKYIVDKVELIESLDSMALAETIDRCSAKINKVTDVLVEINIGGEESKGGIPKQSAKEFINSLKTLSHIRVRGIMVIPPISDPEGYKAYFNEAHRLFTDIFGDPSASVSDPAILSMGMSDSYIEAIGCGSTMVRIGSALFGKREYPEPSPEAPDEKETN